MIQCNAPKLYSQFAILIFCITTISCSSDDEITRIDICIGNANLRLTNCSSSLDPAEYCDPIEIEDALIEDENKILLNLYCLNAGDTFQMINQNQEIVTAQILSKWFQKVKLVAIRNSKCSDDIRKQTYCSEGELISLSIGVRDLDMRLRISLRTVLDLSPSEDPITFDAIILFRSATYIEGVSSSELQLSLHDEYKNIQYPNSPITYEALTLNSFEYYNVFSSDPSDPNETEYKYYFNYETGFIGFTTDKNQTWTISE